MLINGIYDVRGKEPFLVFFEEEETRNIFMQEYHPRRGFGIIANDNNYSVYSNTHRYHATRFVTKNEGKHIGMIIKNCYPIKQKDTLNASIRRVQVLGLDNEYFCLMRQKGSPDVREEGPISFFRFVDDESKAFSEISVEDHRKQIEFISEHDELIRQKKEYEEQHLFSVEYSSFEDTLQNLQDGVVYKFRLIQDEKDEENETEEFSENTSVEITSNDKGRSVMGTILGYEDGWLHIKINNITNAYDRIAKSGTIKERSNPEYDFKIQSLIALNRVLSPNKYLLPILSESKVEPYSIVKTYEPYDVTEKDGSVHKNVNPSQKEAIEKALNVEDFLLVQGPPGTGKTTIITEMINDFVHQGLRVLICSKNNLAVDNVLEKCQNLYYDQEKTKKMQCLRLGNVEKIIPSVRESLSRPLTIKIQNDVREHSHEARRDFLERKEKNVQIYKKSMEDTKILCELIKLFLIQKENYIDIYNTFQSSRLHFTLGKGKEGAFQEDLIALIKDIDSTAQHLLFLMKRESVQIRPEAIKKYV